MGILACFPLVGRPGSAKRTPGCERAGAGRNPGRGHKGKSRDFAPSRRCRAVWLSVAMLAAAASGLTWVESSHSDFADGNVDAQMYVSHRAQLEPDSGCVEFYARFDVDNNGFYDLGCSDDSGPHLTLYLGSDSGYYPANRLEYDIASGGNIDLADLNIDGWAELIHSGWRSGRATIYWGSPAGPSTTDTTVLDYVGQCEDVNVYDLDKDGYLDLIMGSDDGNLYVFWGSVTGYRTQNRTLINLGYAIGHNTEIADFDKDGWGDIAAVMWTYNMVPIIYWGPGRQPRDTTWLPFRWNNAHGITTGDFNRDEWLDIVYTGYDSVLTSYIYFGSDSGFVPANYIAIRPGKCYGGSAAADWNRDARLDIIYFRGNWIQGGRWPPVVYLNTGSPPWFNDSSFVLMGTDSLNASGGFIADFDFDDTLDIFVNNMVNDSFSFVCWGPDYLTRTPLPVDEDHHGVFREPGSSYDRAKTAQYYSSVFDAGPDSIVLGGSASWVSFEPPGSQVTVAYRSGNTPSPDSTWTSFAAVQTNGGPLPGQILGRRYLQYRLRFGYYRPCYLPDLEQITTNIVCTTPGYYDVGVWQILAPTGTLDSGTVVTPTAVIRNYGDRDASFPVRMRIGAGYSDSMFISLAAVSETTLAFSDWVAGPLGVLPVTCFTAWSQDEYAGNDTARGSVTVNRLRYFDVGPVSVLAPAGALDSGTVVVPRVVVRNFGDQDAGFPVWIGVGAGYSDGAWVDLAVGQEDTVEFAPWTADPVGILPIVCQTELPNDQNRANDTVRSSVTVLRIPVYDVGPTAILAPTGDIDSGLTIVPVAVVRNFGNQVAIFPVTMRIGTDYQATLLDTLGIGRTDTVRFAGWTATVLGPAAITCFTGYAQDQNRANDTLRSSVNVIPIPDFDVGPTMILSPVGAVDSGVLVMPRAVVRNYGNQPAVFPVTLAVDTTYANTQTDTLATGQSDTVTFAVWVARPPGDFVVTCYTSYGADMNRTNDTIRAPVTVRRVPYYDVGPTAILAPAGAVDSGVAVVPRVVVMNFGNWRAFFPVVLSIDTGYSETLDDSLDPGESDTLEFPEWTASALGRFDILCHTAHVLDENRSNDTLPGTVLVTPRPEWDVGPTAIIEPAGVVDTGAVRVPRAVVRNHGNQPALFPVVMRVGTSYESVTWDTLAPGLSDTVTFAAWTAGGPGDYEVVCFTNMMADQRHENDTIRSTVQVRVPPVHDVGAAAILSPGGELHNGDATMPRALVANYGNVSEANFEARFRVGLVYSELALVPGPVSPGTAVEVAFPDWTAVTGDYPMSCSTLMPGDADPTNDKVEAMVHVAPSGVLDLEYDLFDHIQSGGRTTYPFWARVQGEQIEDVVFDALEVPPGWSAWLVDSTGENSITGLGSLVPGVWMGFKLYVEAPNANLAGVVESLPTVQFLIRGRVASDTTAQDSTTLTLELRPNLEIHNFPNPVRDRTRFIIGLPEPGRATLTLYTRAGERVCRLLENAEMQARVHMLEWDGANDAGQRVARGVYDYLFEFATDDRTRRVIGKLVMARD